MLNSVTNYNDWESLGKLKETEGRIINSTYTKDFLTRNNILHHIIDAYEDKYYLAEPTDVIYNEQEQTFLWKRNNSLIDEPQAYTYKTSFGEFVSEDDGEYGGKLFLDGKEILSGNFCKLFEKFDCVFAIDSLTHPSQRNVTIYKFNKEDKEVKDPEIIYSNKPSESLSYTAFGETEDKLYILISGWDESQENKRFAKIIELSANDVKVVYNFYDEYFDRAYKISAHENEIVIGLDKGIAKVSLDGSGSTNGNTKYLTWINKQAESNIWRNIRETQN